MPTITGRYDRIEMNRTRCFYASVLQWCVFSYGNGRVTEYGQPKVRSKGSLSIYMALDIRYMMAASLVNCNFLRV